MSATVTTIPRARTLTPRERMQALILAQMHEERASLCAPDQPALRAFLQMNAAFLGSLANDRIAANPIDTRSARPEAKAPPVTTLDLPAARSAVSAVMFEIRTQRLPDVIRGLLQAGFAVSNTGIVNRFRIEDAKEKK